MEMNLKYSIKLLTSHFLLLTFVIFLLTSLTTKATVRYVSKTGLSIPPYTSWEIAADSIQECINVSVFGDTIYVANGVYKERINMIPGLTLVGAGSDSCIIDSQNFNPYYTVRVTDSCYFGGFQIISFNNQAGIGIIILDFNIENISAVVEHNKVKDAKEGISITTSALNYDYNYKLVNKNIILNVEYGILSELTNPLISENIIYPNGCGLGSQINSSPTYINNTVIFNDPGNVNQGSGFGSGFDLFSILRNNLFYLTNSNASYGIHTYSDSIYNNVVYGPWDDGIDTENSIIKNNIVEKCSIGLDYSLSNPSIVQYNNLWQNQTDYKDFTPDSTNLSVDPMFVNEDSMDLHLQKYSPLIDAGDPTILDKDGTRSDIGLYGGPYGESYVYLDLSPRPPVNLSAVYDSTSIILNWNKNTEADFSHYLIYRDVNQNFIADSTKLIAETSDTSYADMISSDIDKLFYKLRAVDNQGNQSAPSEEIFINLTSVTTNDLMTINDYRLYQNYPNPFNPSTKIGYRLKERGYVKLYVYDVKGELVSVLVNQIQEAGYYEAEFSPAGMGNQESGIESLASGIYIYQIMVRGEGDIPVFTDMKKMIFLK